jgi:dTDP-glucose 4,6-dehydratase
MIIVVTGGLGFIGSHLIKYLLSHTENNTIYNIDNMSFGSNRENLVVPNHLELIDYNLVIGDINDIGTMDKVEKPDIILNVAAETHVDRSIKDPEPFVRSNYDGTFQLLEYARKNDVQKFIQVSTDEVYGECPPGYSFNESDRLNPSNPYSASKAAADLLIGSYCKTYSLNACITRCTNNFGPNQFPEKLIPKTIVRILEGLPVALYGSGEQERDWLYVEDHVDAIYKVMHKGRTNETYNISALNLISNKVLVQRIGEIVQMFTGKSTTVSFVGDRPGHDKRYSLDSTKIRKELQWKPRIDFQQALTSTVKWYIENKHRWASLAC